MEKEKQYVAYEYRNMTVSKKLESAWKDGYRDFGWEVDKSQPAIVKHVWGPLRLMIAPLAIFPGKLVKNLVQDHESNGKVELSLKRDKKIQKKDELNKLQFVLDRTLNEMEHMEATKTTGASVGAYMAGLFGTVCMAVSVFSYLAANLAACVGFAVPGFIGWVLSFAVYYLMKNRKEEKLNRIMEQKFEEMNDICLKAYELDAGV